MSPLNSSEPVIIVEKLYKNFDDGENKLEILQGLDFSAFAGESVAIIGRSGTGKSTFLNTLGLLDTPSAGKIILNNTDVSRISDAAKTRIRGQDIGFVFQQYHLFGDLTAMDNVMIAGNFAKKNRGEEVCTGVTG